MGDTEDTCERRRVETIRTSRQDWTHFQRVWLKQVEKIFTNTGPPRPTLELKRREEVMDLRKHLNFKYEELIQTSQLDFEPLGSTDEMTQTVPREAFNRWLMERINAGGIDPLLGGHASADWLKAAAAEGLERDLCGPFVQQGRSNFASKVRELCSELSSKADAAAERIMELSQGDVGDGKVSASLNAKRGCYVFTLDKNESSDFVAENEAETSEADSGADGSSITTFTLSPSALARLA